MTYSAFGYVIETDQRLPELPAGGAGCGPRLSLSWRARLDLPDGLSWRAVWPDRPTGDISFATCGKDRFLRYPGRAVVRFSGETFDIAPDAAADPAVVRHAFLDHILPLALAARGETVLHASAVELNGTAVIFMGQAGAGKSTLAAALSTLGAPVLSDDAVLLQVRGGEAWAAPSYPGLRLWPDSAALAAPPGLASGSAAVRRKRRIAPARSCSEARALPISCVYSLERLDGEATTFTPLSRRDGALELVRHSFTPDVHTEAGLRSRFESAVWWSARLGIWRLRAARDLAALGALARDVITHAGGPAAKEMQVR